MDSKIVCYKLQETLFRIMGKDTMNIRIAKYRYKGMKIGEACRIFSNISTPEPYLVEIGNNVTIATNVSIITHDNSAIKLFDDATDFVGKVVIGDNCFIGSGTIILPGVEIARDTVIGAGSLICNSIIEPGKVVAGNPGRIIGSMDKMKEKYCGKKFDFRGLSSFEKKKMILENEDKFIRR